MMMRFHINAEGDPGLCTAQTRCPFGGDEKHYSTAEEARASYEQEWREHRFPAMRRSTFDFESIMKLYEAPSRSDLEGLSYYQLNSQDGSLRGLTRINFFSNDPSASDERVEERALHVARLIEEELTDRFGGKWEVPLDGGKPVQKDGTERISHREFLELQDKVIDHLLFARV